VPVRFPLVPAGVRSHENQNASVPAASDFWSAHLPDPASPAAVPAHFPAVSDFAPAASALFPAAVLR